jgi:hypothetical protein
MSFVAYFQNGHYPTNQATLNGVPLGEPVRIPRYVLTDIIGDVPDGTTKEMVKEKWSQPTSPIQLEFCAESECPDAVKEQIQVPSAQVRHRVWSRL